MENSERFLKAFAAIEKHLRRICSSENWVNFSQVINEAAAINSIIRRYNGDLKEFAELRNAIVHDRGGGYVIAEPNFRAVAAIEQIQSIITNPPRVIPSFQVDVLAFDVQTPVAIVLETMAKRDISQVPITEKSEFKALLTSDMITKWLGLSVKCDMFSLGESSVGQVLFQSEALENFKFISKTTTLFDVMEVFHKCENDGKRLDAALITESGKAKEKIIGIVTVADFPKMIQKVGH